MIDRPVITQPRAKTTWPAPPMRLPRTESAGSSQILQVVLIILGIGLVTFVLYLYLLPNSQISEAEAQISRLQVQHATLVRQNADIVRQVSVYTDLATIQMRAEKLGMRPARNVIYLPATAAATMAPRVSGQSPTGGEGAAAAAADEANFTPGPASWPDLLRARAAAILNRLRQLAPR